MPISRADGALSLISALALYYLDRRGEFAPGDRGPIWCRP
jgi:hypothetical protein